MEREAVEEKKCPECGNFTPSASKFCRYCAYPLSESASVEATAPSRDDTTSPGENTTAPENSKVETDASIAISRAPTIYPTASQQLSDANVEAPASHFVRTEQNQRENNEDSFHIYDLYLPGGRQTLKVFAIADGMGGHEHGELVSREALRKVSLALYEQLVVEPAINQLEAGHEVDIKTVRDGMWNAVQQTNAHVRRMVQNNKWGKAGATLVLAAILGDRVAVVNLGDSPLFHYRRNTGKLRKVTQDHNIANALLRAGMISPEMVRYHEGRGRLEFFLGAENFPKETPAHLFEMASGDLMLLCTDGVTGQLADEQIERILADPQSALEEIAERLIMSAREVGETDNQTLVLWRHGTPARLSQFKQPLNKEEALTSSEGTGKRG